MAVSAAFRIGNCFHAFSRLKRFAGSIMLAAVQCRAMLASRRRLTLQQTRRIVPFMFSMMFVQAGDRRSLLRQT
jgi:hypothetical protein